MEDSRRLGEGLSFAYAASDGSERLMRVVQRSDGWWIDALAL